MFASLVPGGPQSESRAPPNAGRRLRNPYPEVKGSVLYSRGKIRWRCSPRGRRRGRSPGSAILARRCAIPECNPYPEVRDIARVDACGPGRVAVPER
eukprot:4429338-Alexandrium_andersonii.AAC.1